MKQWKKLASRQEKVGYKTVTFKDFEMPDGSTAEYTTWGKEGSQNVAVIALTEKREVVIARQFRPGPEKVFEELPGGAVDKDETLETEALRELEEETGYTTELPLEPLGAVYRDGYTNEISNYFIAYDCRKTTGQTLDQDEYVEIALISIEDLLRKAKDGFTSDGHAILLAYDKLKRIMEGNDE